ncbi:MAG: right-handed parallel beta-helix repeat-containing protein [Flavobacteriales bacterium]|nr:right-handed parallel beta-helix repeat-containing protein [Flavobacteriales bacterium]
MLKISILYIVIFVHITITNSADAQVISKGEITFTTAGSPYYLKEDLILENNIDLILKPGVTIFLDSGVNVIVKGDFKAIGTADKPIQMLPNSKYNWGLIKVHSKKDSVLINHLQIEEGKIFGKNIYAHIQNVSIKNTATLEWNDVLIRMDDSEVTIFDSQFKSNQTGEGLYIFRCNNVAVYNCNFINVPDAVEFSKCKSSYITGCTIKDNKDDGIDLNDCHNVLISYNVISKSKDRGIEIGSDKQGSCSDITVYRNIVYSSKVGICVKDGSKSVLINNTLVKNKTALSVIRSDTAESGSNVEIINSIFYKNSKDLFIDEYSKAISSYSITNQKILNGDNNLVGKPLFVDYKSRNFSLETGSPCRSKALTGSEFDPEENTIDIGAIGTGHHKK